MANSVKVSPSILSADFSRLGEEIQDVLQCGAEEVHVDVMDGIFVPNITIGIPVVKSLRNAFPDAFLDVHLMITEPVRYVEDFCNAGASLLTLHVESDTAENITKAIEIIHNKGVKAGLSVKPGTDINAIEPWLEVLDRILVMTVEPGFGGQSFMADMLPKVEQSRRIIEDRKLKCDIQVDGGIARDTVLSAIEAGADVMVAGSAVFKEKDRHDIINKLHGGMN